MQVPVQLEPDRVDDLDQVVEALHRVVLRLDRDDHAVRRDEPVDGEQPEVRRAVDEHVVVALDWPRDRLAQDLLAAERGEQLALGDCQVDVRRRDVDARASPSARMTSPSVARPSASTSAIELLDGVEVDAEAGGQIRLRVHVDAEDAAALLGERAGEVDRRRRLADAALLVRDRDDVASQGHHLEWDRRGVGVTVGSGGNATPRPRARARRLSTRLASCSPFCG